LTSLKDKTLKGVSWSLIGTISSQLVRFGIGIILARLLSPSDYGILGMLAIFISVGDALVEGGFSQALIQKKDADKKDFSTVFYINIIISFAIYIILFAFSDQIARFYNSNILKTLIVVTSVGLIIRSLTVVHTTLLVKKLRFKEITFINIATTLFSGAIGVMMAYNGYGVWSLVGLSLSRDLSYSLIIPFISKWRPELYFSTQSAKKLFAFGSRILGVSILDNLFLHLNSLIIGKFFRPQDLGYYTRAYGYRDLISKNISNVIQSVAFPAFALMDNESNRLSVNFRRMLELTLFITTPLLIILVFTAEPLIRFMITEKWLPSVVYLQVLCFAGLFYPVLSLQASVLQAIGKTNQYLFITLLNKIFVISGVIIGFRWGVIGLVYSQVFAMFITVFLCQFYIKQYIEFGVFDQIIILFKYTIFSLISNFTCWKLLKIFNLADLPEIILQVVFSLILYFIICFGLKTIGWDEFKNIIVNRINKFQKRHAK
jgi:teichuronic acid exporter